MPLVSRLHPFAHHAPRAVVVLAASLALTACGTDEAALTAARPDVSASDAPTAAPTPGEPTPPEPTTPEPTATEVRMAVSLEVAPDAKAGWNVRIEPAGFTWAPEHASSEAIDGEGHAHLYIDGEKWGRVYTPWLHVGDDLAPGTHEFRVTLNANDHREYTADGEVVAASTTVEVAEPADAMGHAHDHPFDSAADPAVGVEALVDARAGVNVHLTTSNFTWAPEHASSDAVDGEGHAHLYLDGEKVGRLYGEWFHIGRDLAPGEHEVRVTLNANDHRDYARNGELVEATTTFTVLS